MEGCTERKNLLLRNRLERVVRPTKWKKGGCCCCSSRTGQWETPRPHWSDPKTFPFPFIPPHGSGPEWMDALGFPAAVRRRRKFKTFGVQSNRFFSPSSSCHAHLCPDHFFLKKPNHSEAQRSASLPTLQMSPYTATWPQWGATIGADEGPKLPCGLGKKGKATIASSRLLFGETGDLRRTGPPPPPPPAPALPFFALKPRTRTHITLPHRRHFQTISTK